jgi:hypothetical protein
MNCDASTLAHIFLHLHIFVRWIVAGALGAVPVSDTSRARRTHRPSGDDDGAAMRGASLAAPIAHRWGIHRTLGCTLLVVWSPNRSPKRGQAADADHLVSA